MVSRLADCEAVLADPAFGKAEGHGQDPPVPMHSRFALHDTQISEGTIAAGPAVLMLLGAAGRDPAACADPGRFGASPA